MSVTVCWAAKGGSGTTVVAATLALSCPTDSLLVDLDGELPAVLGLPEPSGQGVADWLGVRRPARRARRPRRLRRPHHPADPPGCRAGRPATRPAGPSSWRGWPPARRRSSTPAPGRRRSTSLDGDVRSLLVTRACYLALRRAVAAPCRPDGVVLVAEPGRALRAADVERAVGAPVVAAVSHDPAIARAVDAGLLAARLPRLLARELRGAA